MPRFTYDLGMAGSVHKKLYPSESLLLLACVASLCYAWVWRSLWSRLLQDQQLPLCRYLGLESTLKATYLNLSMLLFSFPLPITYIHMPCFFFFFGLWNFLYSFSCWKYPNASETFWFSSQFPTNSYHLQSRAHKNRRFGCLVQSHLLSCTKWFCQQGYFFFLL